MSVFQLLQYGRSKCRMLFFTIFIKLRDQQEDCKCTVAWKGVNFEQGNECVSVGRIGALLNACRS